MALRGTLLRRRLRKGAAVAASGSETINIDTATVTLTAHDVTIPESILIDTASATLSALDVTIDEIALVEVDTATSSMNAVDVDITETVYVDTASVTTTANAVDISEPIIAQTAVVTASANDLTIQEQIHIPLASVTAAAYDVTIESIAVVDVDTATVTLQALSVNIEDLVEVDTATVTLSAPDVQVDEVPPEEVYASYFELIYSNYNASFNGPTGSLGGVIETTAVTRLVRPELAIMPTVINGITEIQSINNLEWGGGTLEVLFVGADRALRWKPFNGIWSRPVIIGNTAGTYVLGFEQTGRLIIKYDGSSTNNTVTQEDIIVVDNAALATVHGGQYDFNTGEYDNLCMYIKNVHPTLTLTPFIWFDYAAYHPTETLQVAYTGAGTGDGISTGVPDFFRHRTTNTSMGLTWSTPLYSNPLELPSLTPDSATSFRMSRVATANTSGSLASLVETNLRIGTKIEIA